MSLVGRALFGATMRLRKSRALDIYRDIADAPRLPADDARALQLRLLGRLLDHAERTVPYYRELFREQGITARDVRTLDDFARLPVLTKDIIRERGADMVSEAADRAALLAHHSGGSTGVPLSFYRDRDYLDWSDAGTWRNLAQCGWRPGDMLGFVWGYNAKLDAMPKWEFELRQYLRRSYQFDPFASGPDDFDRWVHVWRRVRPRAVLGYASTVARFAEHLNATGQTVPAALGVFTTAEKLYPQQRLSIAKAFGCSVFDLYGSSEVQNIAAECPAGSIHVNADYAVVETDEPPAPGMAAPLLVTSLRAYAMPFIRYRNEDTGTLVDGACACGGGFPLMRLDIARLSDNFVLPGGKVVHGEYFTHLMYGSAGVASFQFHQTAVDRIVLRVVPDASVANGAEGRAAAVRRSIAEIAKLSPDAPVTVDVEEVDAIALSSAGKHRFTRSDVAPAGAAAVTAVRAGAR